MECPKCQAALYANAKFCAACGHHLGLSCAACGFGCAPTDRFCSGCGCALHKAETESSASLDLAGEGDRREATVVFSDLSGYTAMTEKLDPEDIASIMDRIKKASVEIVEDEGGIVNQFIGDEIVSLFGIPVAKEDDAVRAVHAAIRLHRFVDEMTIEKSHGVAVKLHSGINTGLIVTHAQDERDGRFGLTGDTVNTGARLLSAAGRGEILIGPNTQKAVSGHFETIALAGALFKGKSIAVTPYRILGPSNPASSSAVIRKPLTRFVGRGRELDAFEECYRQLEKGGGQFFSVVADTGVGKTRLFREIRDRLATRPCTVCYVACSFAGQKTAYSAFASLLKDILGLRDFNTAAEKIEKTETALAALDSRLLSQIPAIFAVLGISSDRYPLPADIKEQKLTSAIAEAIWLCLKRMSENKAVALILEDWQWADPSSDQVLKALVNRIKECPVLLAVDFRREYRPSWEQVGYHTHLSLQPFEMADTFNLIKSAWHTEEIPDNIGNLIYERSGGTPLFIEEICTALEDEGTIQQSAGTIAFSKNASDIAIPSSIKNIIQARLDRLDADSKKVVRLAAVIGRQFSRRLVDEVFHGKKDPKNCIQLLESQNLIRHVVVDEEFEFKHALTQRIAYDNLLIQQRKRLHGFVAQSIELLYSDLDEHIEVLAFHYQASDSSEKAAHYLELAGDRAAKLYSVQIADDHYFGALQALRRIESTPERRRTFLTIALKWAVFAHKSPGAGKIELMTEALEIAAKDGDEPMQTQFLYWVGMMHNYSGNHLAAQESYSRSIQLGESIQRFDLTVAPANQLGRSCYFSGEYERGLTYLEKAIRLSRVQGKEMELALSYGYFGLNQSCLGMFDQARESIAEAYSHAGKFQDLVFIATLDLLAAIVLLRQGRWKEAMERGNRGGSVSRKIGLPTVLIAALAVEAQSTYMLGDKDHGLKCMTEAFDLAAASGARMIVAAYYGVFAEMLALSGDLEKAQKIGEEGLLFFDETKMHVGRAITLRALAIVSRLQGDFKRAEARFAESLEHSRVRNARPEHAVTLFRKAMVEAAAASLEQNEDYKSAVKLFAEMDMKGWLLL